MNFVIHIYKIQNIVLQDNQTVNPGNNGDTVNIAFDASPENLQKTKGKTRLEKVRVHK